MRSSSSVSRLLVAFAVLTVSCTAAWANDIYIAQNASGANTGQSCANAYVYTFFNSAGNWGTGTGQIGPGTTVHLCGTFTGPTNGSSNYLTFLGSGASGNPITLRFEAGAVLTSPYWGNISIIYIDGASNIIVDGGTNGLIQATLTGSPGATCIGGPCTYSPTTYAEGGVNIMNSSNIEVKNLTVSDMYVHLGTGDDQNGNSAGVAIQGGGNNISVHNNTLHDCYVAVWTQYSPAGESGYSVFNNIIYNVNWGVAGGDSEPGSSLTNVLIYGNTVHDFANWNNTTDTFHHDGIFLWADQAGSSINSPVYLYNNSFFGDLGGQHCTAAIFMQQYAQDMVSAPYLFNNVVDESIGATCGNGAFSLNVENVQMFNNTFIGAFLNGPNGPVGNALFKNNVLSYPAGTGQGIYDTTAGIVTSDYNDFYGLSSSSMTFNNVRYGSLGAWVSGTGLDIHSITSSPMLSPTYSPQMGSPLIGAGINLYSTCNSQPVPGLGALCYDIAGNPRPAIGGWDIGAYQHVGASVSVTGAAGKVQYVGALTSASEAFRVEFRIVNFGNTCPSNATQGYSVIAYQPFNGGTFGNNEWSWGGGILGSIITDTFSPSYSHNLSSFCDSITPLTGGVVGDMIAQMQRVPNDPTGLTCGTIGAACASTILCPTLGGTCVKSTLPITSSGTTGTPVYFGATGGTTMVFMRWFSTTVDAVVTNGTPLHPIQVSPPASPSTLLGDWEFAGNLNDSSGNAGPMVLSGSGGSVSYPAIPSYPPACSTGAQQTFLAGATGTLTGSCNPLDGGSTCGFLWTQLPGVSPAPVLWTSSQKQANATLVAPQFGSYNFSLTCTDGSNQSTMAAVHDGAVATDSNGVVVYPNTSFFAAVQQYLGPLIQYGKNPWPWYDTIHKTAADEFLQNLPPPIGPGVFTTTLAAPLGASDTTVTLASTGTLGPGSAIIVDSEQIMIGTITSGTVAQIWQRGYRNTTAAAHITGSVVYQMYYHDWWNYGTGPGTITVQQGSTTVTGSGTKFNTGSPGQALCSGGTPIASTYLMVWHPTDLSGVTGRRAYAVASCASDTTLTLSSAFGGGNGQTIPDGYPGGGLTYSIQTDSQLYWMDVQGDPRTIYYDPGLAYLLLYMRSGIDTYLAAFRWLADIWWVGAWDYGYGNNFISGGPPNRSADYLTLYLRSLDNPPSSMTNGLHRAAQDTFYGVSNSTYLGDIRENGYQILDLALVANLDPDPGTYNLSSWIKGQSAAPITYKQGAQIVIANMVSPTGAWNVWNTQQNSTGAWPILQQPVSDGTYYFASFYGGEGYASIGSGSTALVGVGTHWDCSSIQAGDYVWLWSGVNYAVAPASNSQGDSVAYRVYTCNSTTSITLTTAYAGAQCATQCGYQINDGGGQIGRGDMGYMMAIGTWAMHKVADAIATSDPANSAVARTLALNANGWMLTHGFRSDTNGINYASDFVDCPYPVAAAQNQCSSASSIASSLEHSAESIVPFSATYTFNGDAATRTKADLMYNQMWAKPGTCPTSGPCNSSSTTPTNYQTGLDPAVDGFMLAYGPGSPPAMKWLGQFFGMGTYSAWPAVRLGGVAPAVTRQINLVFSLASVVNAAKVVLSVTAPNGSMTSTTCTSSPCQVTVPRVDQPGYTLTFQYQTSGGTTLAMSSPVTVN